MSTENVVLHYEAGLNIYVAAFRSDGKVFDWDAGVEDWVTLAAPPVDFSVSVTERTGTGGSGFSDYWASVDLGLLNPTSTLLDVRLKFFNRVGGSESLSADTVLGIADVSIVSGGRFTPDAAMDCVFTPVYRAGEDRIYFTVQLRQNNQAVTPDVAATCTIVVRQVAPVAGSNLFTVGPTTPDANGLFSLSKLNPTLNEDSSTYRALITIVNMGVTYSYESHFPGYA